VEAVAKLRNQRCDRCSTDNRKVDDVKSVDVDVVIQTRGQQKYELVRRNVPIRIQGKGATAVRYCEVEFNTSFEIVAVRAVDAREKVPKGNVTCATGIQY
jgi:hypothetical protein